MGKCDGCICKDCTGGENCRVLIGDRVTIPMADWCSRDCFISKQLCFCQASCPEKVTKKKVVNSADFLQKILHP